jgi:general secretion pathway protein D
MVGARGPVATALKELSLSLGRNLELDRNGTLALEFEGGETCTIEAPDWENLVYFFAHVMPVDSRSREAMLEWALVANVEQIDLPGAFLALDRATDSLLLCHRIDANGLDAERLTFHSEQPLPKSQVLQIVRDILAKNGLVLKQISGIYHVGTREAITGLESIAAEGRNDELTTQVIRLKKGDPTRLIAVIRPILPAGVSLLPTPGSTSLLVRGAPADVAQVEELLNTLAERGIGASRVAIIPLLESPPEKVAQQLNEFYTAQGDAESGITIIPLENQQALLVGTHDDVLMDGIRQLVRRLDTHLRDEPSLRIIPLENLAAEDIAAQLKDIFGGEQGATPQGPGNGGQRPQRESRIAAKLKPVPPKLQTSPPPDDDEMLAPSEPPQFKVDIEEAPPVKGDMLEPSRGQGNGARRSGGPGQPPQSQQRPPPAGDGAVSIVAEKRNNTLLIYSTYAVFRRIREVVRTLDVPQAQVVIEATVAEVELKDDLGYGVQWYLSGMGFTARSTRSSGTTPSPFPTEPGSGGVAVLNRTIAGFDTKVVLDALQSVTRVKVISSPYLTVLDGKSARLVIGDQIPFAIASQTQTQPDNTTQPVILTQEIETKDTGVILEITPSIRANNSVLLSINQEVSKASASAEKGNLTPIISKRNVTSDIVVQSGRTAVLGGLIEDRTDEVETGVPVLRKVPVLGNLFKQNTDKVRRFELLVMITPRVVRRSSEIENITRMLREQINPQ